MTTKIRYPAEWENQKATWLAFPHNKQNWHGERGIKIRKFYIDLIRTISEFQPVNVLLPKLDFLTAEEKFAVADRPFPATFIPLKTDFIWIRDYGPFFVKRETRQPSLNPYSMRGAQNSRPGKTTTRFPPELQKHSNMPRAKAFPIFSKGVPLK